ncbi:VOC family protein [Streptomyces sp. AcE210]|uniref:VOC family protein n=1 Tax=Streptomyces sp. AcE210 TaxID=2292703 RepID=UPI000E300E27|nr:VOC family protein [Streptomyces sp. AcE210]RFC70882.1 hypothetical protein DXZ75_26990 [Streptomyces sp. AcE210]
MTPSEPAGRMDAQLALGAVELTVADLERSLDYYTRSIGLQVLDHDTDRASVGAPGRVLAQLRERQGSSPAPASGPGLSHFAPQAPTPADLSRFVKHCTATHTDAELTDPSRSAAVMACGTTRRRSAPHPVDAIPPGRGRPGFLARIRSTQSPTP